MIWLEALLLVRVPRPLVIGPLVRVGCLSPRLGWVRCWDSAGSVLVLRKGILKVLALLIFWYKDLSRVPVKQLFGGSTSSPSNLRYKLFSSCHTSKNRKKKENIKTPLCTFNTIPLSMY